jgi:hypothetical protein
MNTFVAFPENLVAVPAYPGYVWDVVDHKLYSFKSGLLKEMKMIKGNHWNKGYDCYHVSRYGIRRTLILKWLKTIKPKQTTVDYSVDGRV